MGSQAHKLTKTIESKTDNLLEVREFVLRAARDFGFAEEEASKILKTISEHWGDMTKLVKADGDVGQQLDKGRMKTIVHWGSEGTQAGRWFRLNSPKSKGTVMRIGLLFPKGSSVARQFLAVEWDISGIAPNEESRGSKQ